MEIYTDKDDNMYCSMKIHQVTIIWLFADAVNNCENSHLFHLLKKSISELLLELKHYLLDFPMLTLKF